MTFVEPKGVKLIASKLVRVFARIRKAAVVSIGAIRQSRLPQGVPSSYTTVKPLQHRQRSTTKRFSWLALSRPLTRFEVMNLPLR